MNKKILIIILLIAAVAVNDYFFRERVVRQFFKPTPIPVGVEEITDLGEPDILSFADNLNIPWEIEFLPGGGVLITERIGNLVFIDEKGERKDIYIDNVAHREFGEGGLLGITAHPDFEINRWVYLYLTTQSETGVINRIERYTFEDGSLSDRAVILDNIPAHNVHNGGRIRFGPDGMLYATTGDAAVPSLPQDLNSLAGKILRMRDDGSVPEDNPFGGLIWSYGHRNPQGLAWDDKGRLWATEHGARAHDELNLIEPGNNYGWPVIQGDESKENMERPVIHSGSDWTWAPSGAEFLGDSVFFAGLRGESLYRARISDDGVDLQIYLSSEFGRLRIVKLGPDGFLYVGTSNRDGRGRPREGDDKIIRINPNIILE